MTTAESDFNQAMKAFDLFTLDERRAALREFASLRYPSIDDRFFEAVHRVIVLIRNEPPTWAGYPLTWGDEG